MIFNVLCGLKKPLQKRAAVALSTAFLRHAWLFCWKKKQFMKSHDIQRAVWVEETVAEDSRCCSVYCISPAHMASLLENKNGTVPRLRLGFALMLS